MNTNQELMQFIRSVNDNIDAEIDEMRAAAKAEADEILAEGEAEGRALSERQLATAQKALAAKYHRRLAQSSYRFHTALLQRRTQLLAQLFAALRERMVQFSASDAYHDWLKQLIAALHPAEHSTILLRPDDMQLVTKLQTICTVPCTFSADDSICLGGCAILSPDGKRRENHTLDDALAEQIRNFHREQHWNGGASR